MNSLWMKCFAKMKPWMMGEPGIYERHTDPGHSWLAVKKSELKHLGIADKITNYSYEHGDNAYLEEDCDLTTFLEAKINRGEVVKFVEIFTNDDAPVRNYNHYTKGGQP